jgi:hypothetical protein
VFLRSSRCGIRVRKAARRWRISSWETRARRDACQSRGSEIRQTTPAMKATTTTTLRIPIASSTYTTFTYTNFTVQPAKTPAREAASSLYVVSFDVTNTGSRVAADVAQVYVGEARPRVARPVRELKGFARTVLKPGETKTVSVPLDARAFAYYDVAARAWRADAGSYRVELGRSSEDVVASASVRLARKLTLAP